MEDKLKQKQQKIRNSLCELIQNQILSKIPKQDFLDIQTQSLVLEDLDFTELYTESAKIQHHNNKNGNYSLLKPQTLGEIEILYNYNSALAIINLNNKPEIKVSMNYSLL